MLLKKIHVFLPAIYCVDVDIKKLFAALRSADQRCSKILSLFMSKQWPEKCVTPTNE